MEWIIAILVFYFGIKYLSFFVSKIDSLTKPNAHFKPKPQAFRIKHTNVPDGLFSNLVPTNKRQADIFMSAKDKQQYMLSEEWQELRTLVFTRDNHTCQSCGSQSSLNCHHVTYINLNNENLEDLITLCKSCHQYQHDIYGYDRVTTYFPIVSRPSTSVLNNSVLPEDSK